MFILSCEHMTWPIWIFVETTTNLLADGALYTVPEYSHPANYSSALVGFNPCHTSSVITSFALYL